MRGGVMLTLIPLVVSLTLAPCRSTCEEREVTPRTQRRITGYADVPTREVLKRYSDIDYDSFVGLMGRRDTARSVLPPLQKRDMHDIFVGLMGRRSSQADSGPAWRKEFPERRGGFYINKCKLRFRRGI